MHHTAVRGHHVGLPVPYAGADEAAGASGVGGAAPSTASASSILFSYP